MIEFIPFQLFLFSIAIFANTLSAFAGGGAGLIQLPLLIFLGLPFSIALATHKVASIALGLGSSLRLINESRLNNFLSIFILAVGIPGVVLGANFTLYFSENFSSIILGILTLSLGIFSAKQSELGIIEQEISLSHKRLAIGGVILFVIGFLNGSLSSGTGLFVTLWLVRFFGLTYSRAVGHTLILVGFFWNGIGALVLGLNGQIKWSWLPMLVLGSILGGYIGAHLSILKGNRLVKLFFEIISIFIGITLVIRGLK
tara:strand:- start:283 stop:1053 length:771 start_codon:yes stop_codon:yes gene_type:complete